jgi:hemolysin activation/secretion protein
MKNSIPVLLTALIGASFNAQAATPIDPAAVQRQEQDSRERALLEQRLQKATPTVPDITVPEQEPNKAEVSNVKNIPVTRFDVDPSELLSNQEIASVLESYQGKTVSLSDLFAVVGELNQLYETKGAKTARAILPAQKVEEGVVRIRLIEAHLGDVKISGLKYLSPGFVSERIHQSTGDLLSVTQLESDLIRFNSLYETKLRADVIAGAKVGTTDISITAQEGKRYQFTTFIDNAGRDSVGEGRVGAVFRANDLTGRHDNLQLVATGTQGSESYGVSYSIPISRNDLRLDASYNYGTIKLINGPFVPLDISGRSKDLSVGLTQPFSISMNRQWAAYGRFSSRNSVSEFGGFTQQDVGLHVMALGLSGEARYDDHAWSVDASLNKGAKAFGGDANFSYFRASASRVDRLDKRFQLITRAGLQYSFVDVLPSGEQFQVGGLYSVRGFPEGLLSGRNGYFGSVELRATVNTPSPQDTGKYTPAVQALVFVDHGAALPYRPGLSKTHDDYLGSAGIGMIMDFGTSVSARLTLAYPLKSNPSVINPKTPRIHAGINISWL